MPRADARELRRTSVDELDAQVDGHRSGTLSSSEDGASNALVRFDDNDIEIESGIVRRQ